MIPAWLIASLVAAGFAAFGRAVVLYFLRLNALKKHFGSDNLRGHLFPSLKENVHRKLPWVLKTGDARLDRLSKYYVLALVLFIAFMLLSLVLTDG